MKRLFFVSSAIVTGVALGLALTLPACDGGESSEVDARDYELPPLEDFAPGCSYDVPVTWNSDYPNRPVECVLKATLCTDAIVGPQCTTGDPVESCWKSYTHCFVEGEKCLKKAASDALDMKP